MSRIEKVFARKILNSRGDWTVEATVWLRDGMSATASVPEGESKGSLEAVSLPADEAVEHVNDIIAKGIAGGDVQDQSGLDNRLIELDGTLGKSNLGGNAILAVSLAAARAAAAEKKMPLFRHLAELYKAAGGVSAPGRPRLFVNVIEGGVHAGTNLRFQEYLVIPKASAFSRQIEVVKEFYASLRGALGERFGKGATRVGDEGGFAADFPDDLAPFSFLEEVATVCGLSGEFEFGLDAAANNVKGTSEELTELYTKAAGEFPLIYLEDPFREEDFDSFANLRPELPNIWIAGDDLTVTSVSRMEIAREKGSINAVIIKPNQRGTVSEVLDAVVKARQFGWKVVASHRGGETDDDFIADFAVAIGADGFKLGAPARGERVAKYNRLLEIESANTGETIS